tara:strand:- start:470 stop:877 length:408 start_codon:yes stop_codon:yes gene_type:complete
VDGSSLLSLVRDGADGWRAFVQGEHTTCYDAEHGMQYVTDGCQKYIWFHHSGAEQFFDLTADPGECVDLSADAAWQSRIDVWRQRLATVNETRGDPRGQGGELVPQTDGALRLSPNYARWRDRAQASIQDWRGPG